MDSTFDHSMALFVFHFYTVCKFGKFINFGLGTTGRSEEVEADLTYLISAVVLE